MMKKTPKIKHPNLHYKINTRKKTPKKNTNFQISSKKTPRKKHQFCKFSKKTPRDKTPISEKGQKKHPKKNTFLTTIDFAGEIKKYGTFGTNQLKIIK